MNYARWYFVQCGESETACSTLEDAREHARFVVARQVSKLRRHPTHDVSLQCAEVWDDSGTMIERVNP